jgi:shikimate dehydrogenase
MITYGLIGYPLLQSGSERYFTRKFRKEKISGRQYKLFPLKEIEQLTNLLQDNPDICGLNVTIPYKEKVLPFLNNIDTFARETGAVNTIKIIRKNGLPVMNGYNTDVFGFEKSLSHEVSHEGHIYALILGTGGASKAIAYILRKLRINYLLVSRGNITPGCISYSGLTKDIIRKYTLIINTTPLGMYPDTSTYPIIPYEYLTRDHFLYDLIYNPVQTEFLKKGQAMGAKVQNGLQMFYNQAELSYSLWEMEVWNNFQENEYG